MSYPKPPVHIHLHHPSTSVDLYLRTPRPPLSPDKVSPDAHHLSTIFSEPANTRYEPRQPKDTSAERYNRDIQKWLADSAEGKNCFMFICLRPAPHTTSVTRDAKSADEETVVGFGGINAISVSNAPDGMERRVADVGLLIHPPFLHKGYGRAALTGILNEAFVAWEVDGCIAETMTKNEPFRGLMKAIGLGRLEEARKTGEEWGDACVYGIERENWEKLKKTK